MQNLRNILITLFLLIVGLAAYGYFKATAGVEKQTEKHPKIEISPKSFSSKGGPAPGWDFGEIEYGKTVEHTFKVKNLGNEALEIKRLSTSCGCTTAKTSKEKIPPGEEVELKVVYDTGAMSGSHAKGKQERTIYVKTNDPVNPQVEVEIRAVVK